MTNLETVRRLQKPVRKRARYHRSLDVLAQARPGSVILLHDAGGTAPGSVDVRRVLSVHDLAPLELDLDVVVEPHEGLAGAEARQLAREAKLLVRNPVERLRDLGEQRVGMIGEPDCEVARVHGLERLEQLGHRRVAVARHPQRAHPGGTRRARARLPLRDGDSLVFIPPVAGGFGRGA